MVVDAFAVATRLALHGDPFAGPAAAPSANYNGGGGFGRSWTGSKYPGSLWPINDGPTDYWTLRRASADLFRSNLYARGLIRRLITNEINVGLTPEAEPTAELLAQLTSEQAETWSEDVEARFEIWADTPELCDFERRRTFAQIQQEARTEALVEGDILVVLHIDRRTQLPLVQLVRGGRVRTPIGQRLGDKIVNGVELGGLSGREHIAYHVEDGFGKSTRIAAVGPRSKRRLAWLEYGTDRRMDQVRGTPLLSLVLQSIKELDRYRDAELRAATINATLALYISKEVDTIGSLPVGNGALLQQSFDNTSSDGQPRVFNVADQVPGTVYEELAVGETPHSFNTGRPNINYQAFESAVISAIAWANEVPPEILMLAFSNNYSASKAAIGEFRAYIVKVRALFGGTFCQPIYVEWLMSEVLQDRITAKGLVEARRSSASFVEFGAWTRASWGGPVKPSIEMRKDVQGYAEAIKENLTTHDRASKDLFGMRFSRVIKKLTKERKLIADMNETLGIVDPETVAPEPIDPNTGVTSTNLDNLFELFEERLRENG